MHDIQYGRRRTVREVSKGIAGGVLIFFWCRSWESNYHSQAKTGHMQSRQQDGFRDSKRHAQDIDGNIECLQPGKRGCCKAAHNAMGEKDCKVYATGDGMKLTKIEGRRKTGVLGLCLGCDVCLTGADACGSSDLDSTTPVDRGFIKRMEIGRASCRERV